MSVTGGQATLVPEGDDQNGVDLKGPLPSIDLSAGSLMLSRNRRPGSRSVKSLP